MFGSQILDVGVGLVFIYTLLSLICTTLKEIVESVLKNRAGDLEKGVRMLLSDDNAAKALHN